jgi:hypothetical protein
LKGVVFTEFLEMVEHRFSPEMADRIIDEAELPSGGVYTAVGTYDHAEIVVLVDRLSKAADVSVPQLLHAFGKHLFQRFVEGFPHFFEGRNDAFGFLAQVEDYIHVEVKKLYPDAELPSVLASTDGNERMTIVYRSDRAMADLAHGLIEGCVDHFGEAIDISVTDLSNEAGRHVRFELARAA